MGVAGRLPWWAKLSAKLMLSRLPVSYRFWRRVGLFRHGDMSRPEHAIATFRGYYEKATKHGSIPPDFSVLELGPGDSVLAGIVAKAYGARRVYLLDAGAFADTNVDAARCVIDTLGTSAKPMPSLAGCQSLADLVARCEISYLTQGVQSFAEIPDQSIDFFWSQVVLEHVPRAEFPVLLRELRRVVRAGAIGVHSIDFRDHLAGSLNNLRFSDRVWESRTFRNSGFYTNRIQCSAMLRHFEEAGFKVEVIHRTQWPRLPLARQRLARAFQAHDEDDLRTAEIEIVVKPA